jgi:hypothetical protein
MRHLDVDAVQAPDDAGASEPSRWRCGLLREFSEKYR